MQQIKCQIIKIVKKIEKYLAILSINSNFGKLYNYDIKSCTGPNFDIISQLYHPLKNDIKNINILKKVIL
jgi:hypothetical protein